MRTKRHFARLLAATAALGLAGCHDEAAVEDTHGHGHNVVSVDAAISGYDWEAYTTHVPHGTGQLVVDLHHLSQDADLYVESPDGAYACESLHSRTKPDSCVFDYPVPGEWYVEVFGWDYDPMEYTVSVTLWPSNLHASLYLLEQATQVTAAMQSQGAASTQAETAQRFLPLLKAVSEQAKTQAAGETAFSIATDGGDELGRAVLKVSEQGHRKTVHLKAVTADPQSGNRYVIQTDARQPLVLSAFADKPEDGVLKLRRKDRSATVRLGAATGTAADVQIVTRPGPVTREQSWTSIATAGISLGKSPQ